MEINQKLETACLELFQQVILYPALLLTPNIPLASRQIVFKLLEAKPILLLYPEERQSALTWSIHIKLSRLEQPGVVSVIYWIV